MPRLAPTIAALALAAASATLASPAQAQEKYLGEIFETGFNWCPRGSALLNGQILPINNNQALFALLGTTFGGDGRVTFALPNMQSRSPMHNGTGNGLTPRQLGQTLGAETVTLSVSNLPPHSHNPRMRAPRVDASRRNPIDSYVSRSVDNQYDQTTTPAHYVALDAIQSNIVGGGQPVDNMMPTLVINYCMATEGIFPSRN